MLTPWVKPVTAGKKIANRTQKPHSAPDSAASLPGVRFPCSTPPSHWGSAPTKKPAIAPNSTAITTYWKRVAQSAPSQASTNSAATASAATTRGIQSGPPSVHVSASPKPIA